MPTTEVAETTNQQPAQSAWSVFTGLITRLLFMWVIFNWMKGGKKTETGPQTPQIASVNLFKFGEPLQLWVFVNEKADLSENGFPVSELIWNPKEIIYGDWNFDFSHQEEMKLSENVQNNASIYLHSFITKSGFSPFPSLPNYPHNPTHVIHSTKQLNRYKRRIIKQTKNLLTGETGVDKALLEHAAIYGNDEIISHWHPNLTINLLTDETRWNAKSLPPPFDKLIKFNEDNTQYKPTLYLNNYWNLAKDFQPINSTVESVKLNLIFQPLSLIKLQMYASQTMNNEWFSYMKELQGTDDDDQDALKEMILQTNPYLLVLTIIVSISHSVFEVLAFKNDIQFWKTRDSLEGLSVRTTISNIISSFIVFLYVLDNDTNFVIRVSVFVGFLIETWKLTKVIHITFKPKQIFGIKLPMIQFEDKSTYVESNTKKYDDLAFKYLSWLFFPLLIIYSIYSLINSEHKSIYSFILGILYGFHLTFGFIMMTPQLFINYKLKSVAHLPWRMMTYKALNTFIDDIFAFVITMPTLYRIGCFRDDVIFFIYLYQRYQYRVDPSRVNEFGASGTQLGLEDTKSDDVTSDDVIEADKKND